MTSNLMTSSIVCRIFKSRNCDDLVYLLTHFRLRPNATFVSLKINQFLVLGIFYLNSLHRSCELLTLSIFFLLHYPKFLIEADILVVMQKKPWNSLNHNFRCLLRLLMCSRECGVLLARRKRLMVEAFCKA